MKGIEIKKLRKNREKHFLQSDGSITAVIYNSDVHYYKNGEYMEIDNSTTPHPISKLDSSSIESTYISSDNLTHPNSDMILVGMDSSLKNGIINRGLIKFNLPDLPTSALITKATIRLTGYPVINGDSYSEQYIIDVHEMTTKWDNNTNWSLINDKYNKHIEDNFKAVSSISKEERNFTTFNITNLVKKWYKGIENNGIMLKAHNENYLQNGPVAKFEMLQSENEMENYTPVLYITYRDTSGYDENFPYQKQQYDFGKSKVNLLNGNLYAEFELGFMDKFKSELLLKLSYNNFDFIDDSNYGILPGWKFNYYQTIKQLDSSNEIIEYLDEDGTKHYLTKVYDEDLKETVFCDEYSRYRIRLKDENYLLDGDSEYNLLFKKDGDVWYLSELIDSTNKVINVLYDNLHRIIKIINSDKNEINITYSGDLVNIVTPKETNNIFIENNKINAINVHGKVIKINYIDNLITSIVDITGIKTAYSYYNEKLPMVSKVLEVGLNDELGSCIDIKYNTDSTTIKDNKGMINNYVFNENGNVECVTTLDNQEELSDSYGVSEFYELDEDQQNHPMCHSPLIRKNFNYVSNVSFEDNTSFFGSNEVNYTMYYDIASEESHSGNRCLKLKVNEYANAVSERIKVPIGYTYTFSFYAKTDCDYIWATMNYITNDDKYIETMREFSVSNNWKRYEISLFVSDKAVSTDNYAEICVGIQTDGQNVCYIDDIQFEQSETASQLNLIGNSNFIEGLNDWRLDVLNEDYFNTSNDYDILTLNDGNCVLKMNSELYKVLDLNKKIIISGENGNVYNFSFWYKNQGINSSLSTETNTKVLLEFEYENEENSENEEIIYSLNTNSNEWQFFSANFEAVDVFKAINVHIISNYDSNNLYLTNFCLYIKEEGDSKIIIDESFEPSSEDNQLLTSVAQELNYDDKLIFTRQVVGKDKNNLYYIRNKNTNEYLACDLFNKNIIGETKKCCHNKWCLNFTDNKFAIQSLISKKDYINIKNSSLKLGFVCAPMFELIVNDCGSICIKVIGEEKYFLLKEGILCLTDIKNEADEFYLESVSEPLFIETSNIYNEDSTLNYDELNHRTLTSLDSNTKLESSVINSKNVSTDFVYNDDAQLIKKSKDNKYVEYTYNDSNLLTSLSNENNNYTFTYDNFLKLKKTMVNNTFHSENFYEENNGNLLKTIYGNETYIKYNYDDIDRIKSIDKNGILHEYTYDSNGNVKRIIGNSNMNRQDIYYYEYDNLDRIESMHQTVRNMEWSESELYSYIYTYKDNKICKKNYNCFANKDAIYVGNKQTLIDYKYLNDSLSEVIFNNTDKINYEYDLLGRIRKKDLNNKITTEYRYISNGKRTTNLVKEIIVNGHSTSYCYDKLNNIVQVLFDGKIQNKYYYDNSNQLLKEKNYALNEITKYTYDNSGNILSKKVYDLTNYNLINKYIFEYNDPIFKDRVTCINGNNITYDEIGNITSNGNWKYEWTNGFELSSAILSDKCIVLDYNNSGIRISKSVSDTDISTKYYLEDNKIIFEDKKGGVISYFYDSNECVGFDYLDKRYFFTKNLFGDIVSVLDENYNVVAEYSYDSWGNCQVVNYTIDKIGDVNPFRFRGYYFDKDLGLYYLETRYYDPKLGRFITQDALLDDDKETLLINLYCYCGNNFIMGYDPSGEAVKKKVHYKASKAVSYANRWCLIYNPAYRFYSADCTNFVSQCLYAGGLPMTGKNKEGWHMKRKVVLRTIFGHLGVVSSSLLKRYFGWDVSPSWSNVAPNMKWLKKSGYANSKTIDITSVKDIKKAIKSGVKKGDIAYFVTSSSRGDGFSHAVIITGVDKNMIRYSCHTISRYKKELSFYFNKVKLHKNQKHKVRFYLMKG